MDTLRKVLRLRDERDGDNYPRSTSENHIQSVLDGYGPQQEVTVGHAVIAAIQGIRQIAGERGARNVDRVFMDPALNNAYLTPLSSPYAEQAHRQIAYNELEYWKGEDSRARTAATRAAVSFDLEQRVQLQSRIGQMVQTGQSFADYLQQQQTFSTGQNPFSQHANNYLPSGSGQSFAGNSDPAYRAPRPKSPGKAL